MDWNRCMCRLLPRPRGLPHFSGGSASIPSLSRPAQTSHVTARWIAQSPKATFVARLPPVRLLVQAARQLPDQSTTLWVESSSTGDTRRRGALRNPGYASCCRPGQTGRLIRRVSSLDQDQGGDGSSLCPRPRHSRAPPIGERPIAPGHHRFDGLYVTTFVSPEGGENFWYVHGGVSNPWPAQQMKEPARDRAEPN